MKVALCYSGQIGAFHKAYEQQKKSFIKDDMDIYVQTSNLISQKNNTTPNFPTNSRVHEYLIAGKGWRENTNTYGIIYKIDEDLINHLLSPIKNQIVELKIEKEDLIDSVDDWDMTKWEWLKKRQLNKLFLCNNLTKEKKYDIVVRSRFEFGPNVMIPIEDITRSHHNLDNKIFMFGGWKCSPPMVFMDEFICDGFAFGTPKVMDIFCSLGQRKDPYPYDIKYKDCWEKFGDNVEYQFKSHLDANEIEIVYISNKRNTYHLWR
tara:strand:+ start:2673 stop:3461 length:789 start_codon:yes stop_codon:yes gene_type:complete